MVKRRATAKFEAQKYQNGNKDELNGKTEQEKVREKSKSKNQQTIGRRIKINRNLHKKTRERVALLKSYCTRSHSK